MAHKLANGNYRHSGILILKRQIATSYGFGWIWKVRGNKFDTLKAAVEYIDTKQKEIDNV